MSRRSGAISIPLYDGCHLFVVPYSIIKNPVLLQQYLQDNRITVTYCSPSLIRLIGDPGPTIRQIQIGGEPANGIFIEGKELVNGYSMSECGFPLRSSSSTGLTMNLSCRKAGH